MLPEIFCRANDCACRPATAVVNASKIPIDVSPTRSQRDSGGQPHSEPKTANGVPPNYGMVSRPYDRTAVLSGTVLPVYGQKLPRRRAFVPYRCRGAHDGVL